MATPSTGAPISPLRERMQHDTLMRGLGSHTQQDYFRHVSCFAAFIAARPTPRCRTISAASSLISMRRRRVNRPPFRPDTQHKQSLKHRLKNRLMSEDYQRIEVITGVARRRL